MIKGKYESFHLSVFISRWMPYASPKFHLRCSVEGHSSVMVQCRVHRKPNCPSWSYKSDSFILSGIWSSGTRFKKKKNCQSGSHCIWNFPLYHVTIYHPFYHEHNFYFIVLPFHLWWTWNLVYTFWRLQRIIGGGITSHTLVFNTIILNMGHDVRHHFFQPSFAARYLSAFSQQLFCMLVIS